MQRKILRVSSMLVFTLAAAALARCSPAPSDAAPANAPRAAAPAEPVARLEPGAPFPPGTYTNLNPAGPATIDLSLDLGVRPVVLYYWIAGNVRSETVFRDLEQLVRGLEPEGAVALYGVAVPREGLAKAETIRQRLPMLGFTSPVLEDTGFVIGKRVGADTVPYISVIDREGRLQLTGGGSLAHVAGDGTVADVIRAAATGPIATYGALPRWYPVRELEGQPAPDFQAALVGNDEPRRWHDLLDGEKLNVLVFWSVDCPHCREELPEINAWLRENPGEVNVVGCARAVDEATRTKTRAFCDEQQLVFPSFVDRDSSILELYRITATPTVLIIGPDGVIDSVIVAHGEGGSFAEVMERKQEELL